jgi:MFS family permease
MSSASAPDGPGEMSDRKVASDPAVLSYRHALRFILLVGAVSLFADMTYEGARSITGPYLAVLGASATAVGFVAGFGELIGYAVRLASGYLSDRTGRYWAVTIFGYCVNLLAVPLLALAGSWEAAAALIVLERMGRAIRTPARDAMLSHAAGHTGLGWGFGLHEALDQTGAVLGPLALGAVLYFGGGYRVGFAVLLIPALLALSVLLAARLLYPRPRDFELSGPALEGRGLPSSFWVYLAAVALIAAGYADFPLIAYHFGKAEVIAPAWIPVLYAVAMATDAIAALALGRLFDRIGLATMVLATIGSLLAAPLAFLGGPTAAVVGMALWGVGMGAQESVMRAAIAQIAPAERRGTAYGVFNALYGAAWFAGSVLLGALYDWSVPTLVAASMLLQAAALPVLLWLVRSNRGPGAAAESAEASL